MPSRRPRVGLCAFAGATRTANWQRRRRLAALLLSGLLSGCAVGPDFLPPPAPVVSGYLPGGQMNPVVAGRVFQAGADIPPRWWELLRSRHLNALIEQGIVHNPDLFAAEA